MSAHEFGHGMHDHVGAIFDRPQQDWRGDRVVDDQRHAVLMRDPRQSLDVRNISGWIADAFAIDRPRVFIDHLFNVVGMVGLGEPSFDTALRKDVRQQGVGGAVKLGSRNDVVAQLGDVDQRILDGGHSGTYAERIHSAFERGHAFFQNSVGGVPDAGVDVALDVQIE